MKRPNLGIVMLALPMLACAGGSPASPDFESIVAKHREGDDYLQCGTVTLDSTCRQMLSDTETCLLAAHEECTPAEARVESFTLEGDPIVDVFFLDPEGDGCLITKYTDTSADSFKGDYGDFLRSVCGGLVERPYQSESLCAAMVAQECEVEQEWYQ